MRIAYLVNQYPKLSHTFIRRELLAMESLGTSVVRVSIRRTAPEDLIEPADVAEYERTRVLLDVGAIALLVGLLATVVGRPCLFWRALREAIRCGRSGDRGVMIHLIYLVEACTLRRLLERERCTHLHAHFGTNPAMVAMLCRLLGGPPYSFTVHGPAEFDRAPFLSLGAKIRHASFVVAISQFCRSQLFRWSDYADWSKVHVVHCGLDASFFQSDPPPIRCSNRFVSVGRLSPAKGQMMLIDAASVLAREGLDFHVVLVGDGEMRTALAERIAMLKLGSRVMLAGAASNEAVREHILQSGVFCLPSFAEGLPVVAMESLALGRPVIATYIAGHPELMESGRTGWMVPAGSADALAAAMREACRTSTDVLEGYGREGRSRVVRDHDIRVCAKALSALISSTQGSTAAHLPAA